MKTDNKYYQEALSFIENTDLTSLPNGKHVIDEGNVWVNIVETKLRPACDALLEVHDKFIDIHIPISAAESYGTKARNKCNQPKGEMNTDNDILFYDDAIEEIITKQPGEMTVFAPDMAHAPLIGDGPVRKAIFKVRFE